MGTEVHWDAIYRGRATEELGWYEPVASTLDLVQRHSCPSDAIIDVGGGDSRLVDDLVEAGYDDLTVLDLSEAALDRVRNRLGAAARHVTWINADVTTWIPSRTWSLWHDRAVFHFLTAEADRRAYKAAAQRSLHRGGRLVVAVFAPDGPDQCAGLAVERYDVERLSAVFDPEFRLLEHLEIRAGRAGVGDTRPYLAAALQRI